MDVAVAPLPPGVTAQGDLTFPAKLCAFLLGTFCVFTVLPVGVAGILLSDAGLRRVGSDPRSAARLLRWSWIIFGVTDALVLVGVVVFALTSG